MTDLILIPREGMFLKDGREWAIAATGHASSLDLPMPSTLLGALRTACGRMEEVGRKKPHDARQWKELAARRITLETKDPPQEQYAYVVFPVLDRVQVSMTTYTYTSRIPSSIMVATKLDSRFQGDRDFPNAWRHIVRKEEGKRELGPTHPFDGTGMYLKVTPLVEPAGALFVEYHRVSLEPKKWFDNPNQLRSKLPFLIRDEVRAFRHSLKKKPVDR